MTLGEKIQKLRKDNGWSQTELGKRVDVHVAHLSRLENGKSLPSVDLLSNLARAFGVSMDYLMDEHADELEPVSVQDKSLAERMQLLDALDDDDRQTVIHVIDSMLTKHRMRELLEDGHATRR